MVKARRHQSFLSLCHPRHGTLYLWEGGLRSEPPNTEQAGPATASSEVLPEVALEPEAPEWARQIGHEGARRVLLHLERFGQVTEAEVEQLTGSPRQARVFSNQLDEYRERLPFAIEIDARSGSKTYLKR